MGSFRTWYRGPVPRAWQGRANVQPGYRPWGRGDRLGYFLNAYPVVDYRTLNRQEPRRGYHWVRDERGDMLLVAIATGVIADIIISSQR